MNNTSNPGHPVRRGVLLALLLIQAAACVGAPPGATYRPPQASDIPVPIVPRPEPAPAWKRGVWVSRFEWRDEAEIRRIMDDAASAGLTDVFFQVRGNGTVLYPSAYEPWSEQFGFRSPGYDPLASALREAHARGLRLHAWINVLPGWRGDIAKADPAQLVRARPQWFLAKNGEPAPLEGSYFWLDPAHPSVQAHVVNLCRELVRNYALDGLHLDHVRCPPGYAKPAAVTELVRDVRSMLAAEPSLAPALSAAVFPEPELALQRVGQDWGRWARDGLVDALVSMNYTDDDALFASRVRTAVGLSRDVPVMVGVGVHKLRGPQQATTQAEAAFDSGAAGVCLFSYGSVFTASGRGAGGYAGVLRDLD